MNWTSFTIVKEEKYILLNEVIRHCPVFRVYNSKWKPKMELFENTLQNGGTWKRWLFVSVGRKTFWKLICFLLIFPYLLTSTCFPLKGKIWLDAPEPSAYRGPIHYTSINQETWYSVTMTGIVSESSVCCVWHPYVRSLKKRGKLSCTEPQLSLRLLLSNTWIVREFDQKTTPSPISFQNEGVLARIANNLE